MGDFLRQDFLNIFSGSTTGFGSFVNFALNGSTLRTDHVFQAEEAATITHLGFRYGTRTGTPPTYKISLQATSVTTGIGDGTVLGGGSPASATFTPPASTAWNSTWQWITLDNSYAVTRGQELTIVIEYSSGTIDASNCGSFTTVCDINGGLGKPYASQTTAGTASKSASQPVYGYKSASAVYGCPIQTVTNRLFSLDTGTADEYGLAFTIPTTWCSTFKVLGAKFGGQQPAAGKTIKMLLTSGASASTVHQSYTFDTDMLQGPGTGAARNCQMKFSDSTLATLNAGTQYVLSFQPQEASTGFGILIIEPASSAEMPAFPGTGTTQFQASRLDNGGTWDLTATGKRPLISLILDDMTAPSGGGGSANLLAGKL